MKITIVLLFVLTAGFVVYAQSNNQPFPARNVRPRIVLSDTTRYELFTLEQMFLTVKIDRYTGKTFQYGSGQRKWFPIDVRGGLPVSAAASMPKYDLYDEGGSVFLINNETGQTWVLNVRSWEPILD